jgi:hypothetical protein
MLVPDNIKQIVLAKTQSNTKKTDKTLHKLWDDKSQCENMHKEKKTDHSGNHRGGTTKSKNIKNIFICMSHLWFEWT